jgi:hypothetical protein
MPSAYFLLGKLMSELVISSKEIGSWLERETKSTFIPVHSKAQKLLGEMRKTLENLEDVSKMLLDNSGKEIEKRNMKTYKRARALNKLGRLFTERMHKMKVPEKVTYDSFHDFVNHAEKAFNVTDVDVRNWFPKISPFFILDRRRFLLIFEKSKDSLKDLRDFLNKEYVKTKTLEETFQAIEKLLALEHDLASLEEKIAGIQKEKSLVEKEIVDRKQRLADLRGQGSMSQLIQTRKEISALSKDVKHNLRHFKKPFLKLQSMASRGGGSGLTPEELNKLRQYMESPFQAFATEETGHPILSQILIKLDRLVSEEKLKLKSDKARKAQQDIGDINSKNSLSNLHQRCRDAMSRRTQLSTSQEVAKTQEDISTLHKEIEDLIRKKEVVETKESVAESTHTEISEKIQNHKSDIEKNVMDFLNQRVRVQ